MVRIFKHYIPKSLIALTLSEVLVFILSIYAGVAIRLPGDATQSIEEVYPLFPRALLFALVMVSCMTSMGLYQRHLRDGRRGMVFRLVLALTLGFFSMSVLFYLFPGLFLGRGVIGFAFVLVIIGVVITRLSYIKIVHQDTLNRRVMIIGAGKNANLIEERLKRKTDRRGFTIVGYIDLPEEDTVVEAAKVLHPDVSLLDFAVRMDVDEIVVAVTDRRKPFPVEELVDCKMSGIEVVDLLTFFERQAGRIILDILTPRWLIFSDGFRKGLARDFLKRLMDVFVSIFLFVPAIPIMVLTAVVIKLDDRGPVFYKQVRVGKNWKLFQVRKFRSMGVDAEKDGAKFAEKNDIRVTRVGGFIRKTRIDELPQLLNVMMGDMSFVGPRPERPTFVEKFTQEIPYYSERHRVKPGLTGWAQIGYPYGASDKDTIEKLQFDLYYVKNYSVFLDVMILFQTAEVILWGKGAR